MKRTVTITRRMENFEKYSEYNRILRTWFVIFGVSGPAAILANEVIRMELVRAQEIRHVVLLFLVGAGTQVVVAGINKFSNWYCYDGQLKKRRNTTIWYRAKMCWRRLWIRLIDYFWIDIIADCITAVAFLWAIWKMLTVFAAD